MNVLLVGSGGREHGLAWKLAQSPVLGTLWATPGNPGIAREIERANARRDRAGDTGDHGHCFATDLTDHETVLAFCETSAIDLVVIGPEAPLVDGLADSLRAGGIAVFGPGRDGARLEGSKAFTKALCARAGIPTAAFVTAHDRASAAAALDRFGAPVVVKADGLAAGKGVTVATTRAEADAAVATIFAVEGACAVIEECLTGEEVSLFVLTDGTAMLPFGDAQDHKRVGEGDTGPNTGGMGAYSPAPVLTRELEARAIAEIVAPTLAALRADGIDYRGVLYAGLMLTADGPKLIEYNARFGDPECQALMMRLDSDVLPLLHATAVGALADAVPPRLSPQTALSVVMAARGYPGTPEPGGAIGGIDAAEATGAVVFQAGTRAQGDAIVASGGRILAVTARGDDLATARAAAYRAVDAVDFPTGFYRGDIGARGTMREL